MTWNVSFSPYPLLVSTESTYLHSNHGQHLHCNAVELIEAAPGTGLSQAFVDIATGLQ